MSNYRKNIIHLQEQIRSLYSLCFIFFSTLLMILCMIAAMSSNRVIGQNNKLPWHLPEDLKRFKELTLDSTVVMWRSTYESIGKPLPWRENIVISSTKTFPWTITYNDPELAYTLLEDECDEHDEVFIIWWATLYNYFIDRAERLYLTEIKEIYQWDTFFPDFEDHFEEVERIDKWAYDFVTYRKKRVE